MRAHIGDRVRRIDYSEEIFEIPDIEGNRPPWGPNCCMVACGDDECLEWVVVTDDKGGHFHVSDCQLEPAP